jgi:hypothetical protein
MITQENISTENVKEELQETNQEANKAPASDDRSTKNDGNPQENNEKKSFSFTINIYEASKQELIDELKRILETNNFIDIKDHVEELKVRFYKKHHSEIDDQKNAFIKHGGKPEDFKTSKDPLEQEFKQLYKIFREQKNAHNEAFENEKNENLKKKLEVIEEINNLINKQESLNKTFEEFRALQDRWRETGPIPQQEVKGLWNTYHHTVSKFYDYIKINKELRDLDLKKNQEDKIALCEKAEALHDDPKVINAYNHLQDLHNLWREIGPAPKEMQNELWERFKEASRKINKRHQEYFINLREEKKKNLEEKKQLIEQINTINELELSTAKEWKDKSDEMINIQKKWKAIGPIPQKGNQNINKTFKNVCDTFFEAKRSFFEKNKEKFEENIVAREKLYKKVNELIAEEKWDKNTKEIIQLQKKWKNIGPVPKSQSDKLWKKFRGACDEFFKKKEAYYASLESKYEDNLKEKEKLIDEIKAFTFVEDMQENLKLLKQYQKRWNQIGFVPIKEKSRIQNEYSDAINKHFDSLKVDKKEKDLLKYKNKINTYAATPKSNTKLKTEREKLFNQLKKIDDDIILLENNIGFFNNSKNAQTMIKQVQGKIEDAKKEREIIEEKIRLIDNQ